MARKKRTLLPPVTEHDLQFQRARLRPTPNGGWAWRCHYCNRYASSISRKGHLLCRCHGGVTPRQRDPWLQYQAWQRTGKKPRQPGRPLKHGWYSRTAKVDVLSLVNAYRARQDRPQLTSLFDHDDLLTLRP